MTPHPSPLSPREPRGAIAVHLARDPTHLSEHLLPDSVSPSTCPRAGEGGLQLGPCRFLNLHCPGCLPLTLSLLQRGLCRAASTFSLFQGLCLWWQSVWSALCPTSPPPLRCLSCSSLYLAVPCPCLPPAAPHLAPAALWTGLATLPPRGLLSTGHTASGAHMQFGLCACPEVWGHRRHPEGSGPSWAAGA